MTENEKKQVREALEGLRVAPEPDLDEGGGDFIFIQGAAQGYYFNSRELPEMLVKALRELADEMAAAREMLQ